MRVCDRCRELKKQPIREYRLVDPFQSPLWIAELCDNCKEVLVVTILGFMSMAVSTRDERPELAPGS